MPDSLPDWARTQREWLRPTVVGRLGIHPPWCDPVGDVPVSIDPGPTFGHGAHPTTTLVLAEVDGAVSAAAPLEWGGPAQ